MGYINFAILTITANNFDVIGNLILNLKVELDVALTANLSSCHLCYQSTEGGEGLSCWYFVCTADARSVNDS